MASKQDYSIQSSRNGLRIAISIFADMQADSKPQPIIVMGHGIGAIKDADLAPFARALAAHKYTAVIFDYLHFGQSAGEPRNLMNGGQQLQDFRDVISWVRSQPDKFDVGRIVARGTSFGGMHTTALLAEDHELAGAIAQCPCVDGLAAAMQVPFSMAFRLTWSALYDLARSLFGFEPVYVNLTADGLPGSPLAIMTGLDVMEGWNRLTPEEHVPFPNKITSRSLISLFVHRPVRHIHRRSKPYLIVVPTWDSQAPLGAAEKAVELAPKGEGLRVPGGHFDLYFSGPAFKENIMGQLEFLHKVLGMHSM
ncbi:hypothetical protein FOBRF1_006472 [Fusarium oxysporum]